MFISICDVDIILKIEATGVVIIDINNTIVAPMFWKIFIFFFNENNNNNNNKCNILNLLKIGFRLKYNKMKPVNNGILFNTEKFAAPVRRITI